MVSMAARTLFLHRLKKSSHFSLPLRHLFLPILTQSVPSPIPTPSPFSKPSKSSNPFRNSWDFRSFSHGHGHVNLVLSGGKPKFEVIEPELPKKKKWLTKKRLKLKRKREKQKRREASKTDPRRIRPKGVKKKQRFSNAEERIKYKLEKAKLKEALLVEKLKKYEVPKLQGPMPKPEGLTGEERFFLKKMAQKRSNYVPVGRRGIFGGVILNMHLHWKKHETVKVVCKPCKPGQVHEYASEIARLSGGTPIQIVGDDTIVFYRGKNYVQPEVMSPIDTLSKKKALVKSKYEQSLETVRRFIAISEKELELYYRHLALYGDPNTRNSDLLCEDQTKFPCLQETNSSGEVEIVGDCLFSDDESMEISDDEILETEGDSEAEKLSELELFSRDEVNDTLSMQKCRT